MRKLLFYMLLFFSLSLSGQETKPTSNFKVLPTYSFSYHLTDSSVWIYKGKIYGWTNLTKKQNGWYAKMLNGVDTIVVYIAPKDTLDIAKYMLHNDSIDITGYFTNAKGLLKVDKNPPITPATHTKITYDAKGLVTAGSDITTASVPDTVGRRYLTDTQLTALHPAVTLATNSGLTLSAQTLAMGTPSTITASSTNSVTTSTHTHAITGLQPTITPAALTKTDDTNVTLTLSGSPTTALLNATGITAGWTGTLADSRIASASTWNAKQTALNGTGYLYFTGTTPSYRNETYSLFNHTHTGSSFSLLNNQWFTSFDSEGNPVNLFKISQDNLMTFAQKVAISSLNHTVNAGFNDIVNIPLNSSSPSGTEHGVGFKIGKNRILKISGISDGAGGLSDTLVTIDAMAQFTDRPVVGYFLKCISSSGLAKWMPITGTGTFRDTWNATTDSPALNSTSNLVSGDWYRCVVAGTWNSIAFSVGDDAYYNGTTWRRVPGVGYTLQTMSTTVLGGAKIDGVTVKLNASNQLYVSTNYAPSSTVSNIDHIGDVNTIGVTSTLVPSGVTAGVYTKITVNAKGLATAGSTATTYDITPTANRGFITPADSVRLDNLDTNLSNKADKTITITTTSPLTIDGTSSANLSANRTLAISAATQSTPGSMSAADKLKLDGISAGAGTGTVTSITAGNGLTGGTITTVGTVAIDTTKVLQKTTAASMYQPKGSYEVPLTFSTGLLRTGNTVTNTITQYTDALADARVVAGITGKENTIPSGTIYQYWRGDKTWQTLPAFPSISDLSLLNNQWFYSFDSEGNRTPLFKISQDNRFVIAPTLEINKFYHAPNSGMNSIVDIPLSSLSAGKQQGVDIRIGGVKVFKAFGIGNLSGRLDSARIEAPRYLMSDQASVNKIIISKNSQGLFQWSDAKYLFSLVKNCILFASDTNVMDQLPLGTAGQMLLSGGINAPYWSTPPTINNGTLSMGVSGTGLTGYQTFTANQSAAVTFTVGLATGYQIPLSTDFTTWNNKISNVDHQGGDVTGSNALTIVNTGVAAGVYNNITTNAKGQVTAGSNIYYWHTGNHPTTHSGYGIADVSDISHVHGNISKTGNLTGSGTGVGVPLITGTGNIIQAGAFGTSPGTFSVGNHGHGGISNTGTIGTTSGFPLITGAGGVVSLGTFGTGAYDFAIGNHTHSQLHDPASVTTTSGLSISGQQISLQFSGSGENGALSSTDWNTFNDKGNVTGPYSSTDQAIATFSGTSGKIIQNNSGVTISGLAVVSAYNFQLSDRRLKTNIKPIQDLSKFDKIKFVQGTMKSDTTNRLRYMVIAQDVEKVAKELIFEKNDSMKTKTVNYDDLQNGKIARLEQIIEQLEKRIQDLEFKEAYRSNRIVIIE